GTASPAARLSHAAARHQAWPSIPSLICMTIDIVAWRSNWSLRGASGGAPGDSPHRHSGEPRDSPHTMELWGAAAANHRGAAAGPACGLPGMAAQDTPPVLRRALGHDLALLRERAEVAQRRIERDAQRPR